MNIRKRNKLKAKRTPWIETRFAIDCFMVLIQNNGVSKAEKIMGLNFNDACTKGDPLCGSKTA